MKPLVSILLPNLNYRSFLDERIETILRQSLTDWELIVIDNYSDDGSWEFFQELAGRDGRVRISQAPRQGMYPNWNNCIRQARGQYVYIATSDDTMPPDCLERLAGALERHPDCDLAHCRLRMIDEKGQDAPDWWSRCSTFVVSRGDLLEREHVCRAPYDGLLHLTGSTVYTSITQLLIRRSLFDQVGLFESRWGGMGDFNWDMRASLVANTVHVPGTWGGWRIHSAQATAANDLGSPDYWLKTDQMILDAIQRSRDYLPDVLKGDLLSAWMERARNAREVCYELQHCANALRRRSLLLKHLAAGSWAARRWLMARLTRTDFSWPLNGPTVITSWLAQAGEKNFLIPC